MSLVFLPPFNCHQITAGAKLNSERKYKLENGFEMSLERLSYISSISSSFDIINLGHTTIQCTDTSIKQDIFKVSF